jgi:hypothetical protein
MSIVSKYKLLGNEGVWMLAGVILGVIIPLHLLLPVGGRNLVFLVGLAIALDLWIASLFMKRLQPFHTGKQWSLSTAVALSRLASIPGSKRRCALVAAFFSAKAMFLAGSLLGQGLVLFASRG